MIDDLIMSDEITTDLAKIVLAKNEEIARKNGNYNKSPRAFKMQVLVPLLECIRNGNYISTACRVAGITQKTFYDWKKKGEDGVEPYATFINVCEQADALGEIDKLDMISEAGANGKWTANAWILERKYPERYGYRQDVNIGSEKGVNINFKPVMNTRELGEEEKRLLESDSEEYDLD